jgi:hypothetical protein
MHAGPRGSCLSAAARAAGRSAGPVVQWSVRTAREASFRRRSTILSYGSPCGGVRRLPLHAEERDAVGSQLYGAVGPDARLEEVR